MGWLQPNTLRWNKVQLKAPKFDKIIPIEVPKQGKKGKQRDREETGEMKIEKNK